MYLPSRQIAIDGLHSVFLLNRFLQKLANFVHFILSLEVGKSHARRSCVLVVLHYLGRRGVLVGFF